MDAISLMLTKRQLQRLAFELDARRGKNASSRLEIEELLRLIVAALRRFDKPAWEQRVEAAAVLGTSQITDEDKWSRA